MKKILTIFLAVIFMGALSVGCVANKDTGTEPLVIGMELAYPPFETKDDKGNPAGVSVDLANALGESLGRSVKIENTNWDGLIPSLQTGKVDVVISSMTITEERKEVVDFSVPYSHSYLALLINKKSGINTVEDLDQEGKIIDVKKGNTELLSQIDNFIEEYKENGGFDEITNKYMAEEKQIFDELGFPWFFD